LRRAGSKPGVRHDMSIEGGGKCLNSSSCCLFGRGMSIAGRQRATGAGSPGTGSLARWSVAGSSCPALSVPMRSRTPRATQRHPLLARQDGNGWTDRNPPQAFARTRSLAGWAQPMAGTGAEPTKRRGQRVPRTRARCASERCVADSPQQSLRPKRGSSGNMQNEVYPCKISEICTFRKPISGRHETDRWQTAEMTANQGFVIPSRDMPRHPDLRAKREKPCELASVFSSTQVHD
jgi:hypothetical protein